MSLRSFGRAWRAARRSPIRVWHHPAFRVPMAAHGQPLLDPRRADDALTWALDAGVLAPGDVEEAPELQWSDAARVHDSEYLASLDQVDVLSRILATPPEATPVEGALAFWRRGAGGVLAGLRASRATGHPSVVTAGGFHHAEPARGGGYCGINDIAIAIAAMRSDGLRGDVVVVDFDAHPPDGTVACVADDPAVTVLSVSVASHWTVPTSPRVVDARVPAGSGDPEYLAAVDAVLARSPHRVEAVLYLAGTDPLAGDPLGGLQVSEAALRSRDRKVFDRFHGLPIVVVPAGGYTDRAWRVLAGTLAEAARLSVAIPDGYDPLARRTRRIARTLDPRVLTGADDTITEADLFGDLGVGKPKEQRFLGYYTRHGLEHALTAHGFLPTLRAMGFRAVELSFELLDAHHRLLITADVGGERAPLVDLCVSMRVLRGFRVLFVEWLEMQDPRAAFIAGRPRLPGQRAPGLGLAPEVGHLLVTAATRLSLDGVGLVPAHYHVAWMSRHRFVPLDPQQRGEFRALCAHLSRVPLAVATDRLTHGGVFTEAGIDVRWARPEMVIPLSDALKTFVASTEDEAERAEVSLKRQLTPIPDGAWDSLAATVTSDRDASASGTASGD